jgi:hypothetical protein
MPKPDAREFFENWIVCPARRKVISVHRTSINTNELNRPNGKRDSPMTGCRLILRLPVVGAAMLIVATASAAPPPSRAGEHWIIVPSKLVSTRAVRGVGVPARSYRCVVEVPRAANVKAVNPRMLTSSGEPALDALGWEYVREKISTTPALKVLLPTKDLVFQLQITPPTVENSEYRQFPEVAHPDTAEDGYWTPKPPYPYSARRFHEQGTGAVKVTFSHATGRPLEVMMQQSTGSPLLDSSSIQWAALQWRRLRAGAGNGNDVKVVPITYRLVEQFSHIW